MIENCDEPISDEEYERDIDICETLRKRISKLERVPANRLIQTTYNYDFFMLDINTNTKELYGPDDFEEKVRPCFVVSDKKLENDYDWYVGINNTEMDFVISDNPAYAV